MENAWPIILPLIACFFLISKAIIIPSGSCCAIIALGNFKGFIGPGFHFKWSGSETTWLKLTTGDRGSYISNGLAKFGETDLPIYSQNDLEIGSFVLITGFRDEGIEVTLDPKQSRFMKCEKCGHENIIK